MTEAQALEAILEQWESGWEVLHPPDPEDPDHVPYTFDNEALDAPSTWARVTVIPTTRHQATIGPLGGRRFEMRGTIMVQLFGDANAGAARLAELCDDARTVLEARRFGTPADVVTYGGSTRVSPPDGRWSMRIVSFPFWVDEQR